MALELASFRSHPDPYMGSAAKATPRGTVPVPWTAAGRRERALQDLH